MGKAKKFDKYIFVLNCITYEEIGVYEVKAEDLHKIGLDPRITSMYDVPRKIKDLQGLIDWDFEGGYDHWEDHSPFNFDDFYKHAKQIETEENTFFVSE